MDSRSQVRWSQSVSIVNPFRLSICLVNPFRLSIRFVNPFRLFIRLDCQSVSTVNPFCQSVSIDHPFRLSIRSECHLFSLSIHFDSRNIHLNLGVRVTDKCRWQLSYVLLKSAAETKSILFYHERISLDFGERVAACVVCHRCCT